VWGPCAGELVRTLTCQSSFSDQCGLETKVWDRFLHNKNLTQQKLPLGDSSWPGPLVFLPNDPTGYRLRHTGVLPSDQPGAPFRTGLVAQWLATQKLGGAPSRIPAGSVGRSSCMLNISVLQMSRHWGHCIVCLLEREVAFT
jgi:hypothetical protein